MKKIRKNNIKLLLVKKGFLQKWVADQIGVSNTTMSLWATNNSQPNAESLMKLMNVLNCTPEDLYGKL
tara:strand:+ start:550 stop:753 length:204 start_codon:yes stop_codon:yes gene_type:complete